MSPHVSCYHITSTGAIRAMFALEGFFASMSAFVGGQVIASAENLVTFAALVRLQTRMESRVAS